MVAAISQVGQVAQSAKPQAAQSEASFAKVMSAVEGAGKTEDQVRTAARQLVSIAFVAPLLKQARQDPFKTELFHGGSAEETFGAQLDSTIADRMTAKSNFPMVDAVYRSIMSHANRAQGQGSLRTPASKNQGIALKVNVNG